MKEVLIKEYEKILVFTHFVTKINHLEKIILLYPEINSKFKKIKII